jgi:catechol 2,3-dioxygenase-like lactoylglutathione lyase family enzyme
VTFLLAALVALAPLAFTQPPPTPPLAGIAHAAIRVADLETSRAFYLKLGFQEAFAFDKNGVTTQSFIKINDRQFIELYPRTQPKDQVGFMHVCFESADITALNSFYLARGLTPNPVRKAAAGNLLFTMEGPEHQNIEYTQYMPGSRHSNDFGQHLGTDRISTALVAAAVVMQDPAAAQAFYIDKLAFASLDHPGAAPNIGFPQNSVPWLRLPGSAQSIAFTPDGSAFRMIFAVDNLKQTAARLQALKIPFVKTGASLSIHDPDGNILVFVLPMR